jgi:hypothetical protein
VNRVIDACNNKKVLAVAFFVLTMVLSIVFYSRFVNASADSPSTISMTECIRDAKEAWLEGMDHSTAHDDGTAVALIAVALFEERHNVPIRVRRID